jgi:predicted alpha-1,2-mannosidase
LWDTYRAAHSLYTILTPERVNDFVISMLEQGDAQGYLPIWALWGGETHCMIGNHAIPVIVEAWRKGFRNYDGEWAMDLIRRSQTEPHKKSDWANYVRYGYYPQGVVSSQAVSKTLENSYDDYAAAEMAKMLGKSDLANYFAERAQYFKNIYDAETLCVRPRLEDGSWESPFNEREYVSYKKGGAFTEATSLQYTWHVQHDVDWLIDFMGGREKFVARLDSLFVGGMVGSRVDITGLIGHYAHGNEPCHHIPYLYTLAGRPDRAAEVVRKVFDTQYSPRHDGLCGNDDCGQMSAWYIFSAMGFYPVDPVSCRYVLGAPQFEQITLNLPNGKRFAVVAEGLSREAKYVEKVFFNGVPLERNYITHDEVMQGGELQFVMTK